MNKGVYVIPDILANAAGVCASFWEWSLSLGHPRHIMQTSQTFEEVRANLVAQLENATDQVLDIAGHFQVNNLREAAWLKATKRINEQLLKKHGKRWFQRKGV